MDNIPQAPVACSLSQADLADRAVRWRNLAASALNHVTITPLGQWLTFTDRPATANELEKLTALERDCCAFATWSVEPAAGQLILDISATSPEGAEAVHTLFADLPRAQVA